MGEASMPFRRYRRVRERVRDQVMDFAALNPSHDHGVRRTTLRETQFALSHFANKAEGGGIQEHFAQSASHA